MNERRLPTGVAQAIEAITPSGRAARTADELRLLTEAYRSRGSPDLQGEGRIAAYLQVRMPATYAAILAVFRAVSLRVPSWAPASVLDLGTGPGTALYAARVVWPSIERMTGVDRAPAILEAAREIARRSGDEVAAATTWIEAGFEVGTTIEPYDLVVCSYAFGELRPEQRRDAIARITDVPGAIAVIVEPGTPRGYDVVIEARTALLERGWHVLAPCPTEARCPMKLLPERWCHFSTRLERDRAHRDAKGGTLPFEDEKFSYVAMGPEPHPAAARVVGHPRQHGGFVELELCSENGIESRIVSRKHGGRYAEARRLRWGDELSDAPRPPTTL
jgi:ribosomal protein RSM22 (predicted rRNA methylase)